MSNNDTSIDAVISWVDGSDHEHRQKRLRALEAETGVPQNQIATAKDPTRFLDNGEIYFCIHSIRKFIPWIRRIYLVTDNQKPEFLTPEVQKQLNIHIVDHTEIFAGYEWALPVFSSRTIETALWRIPDIAPRFIYFNDDFVLTRPLPREEFFTNGSVVLRGKWSRATRYGNLRMKVNDFATHAARRFLGITRSMHLLLQIRSARLAGIDGHYFRMPHVPHPIRTETLHHWFDQHHDLFKKNIAYKFRNSDQFSALFVAHHLEIQNGRAELRDANDHIMINGEMDIGVSLHRKLNQIERRNVGFVCLNGMEKFKERHRQYIKQTLDALVETEDKE